MSQSQSDTPIVGGIIEIDHTDDYNASSPTWNLVAHTADEIELSANTETAEIRQHGNFAMDVSAVSEAWELTFSKKITTGAAGFEVLNLISPAYEMKGSYDTREGATGAEAIRISHYNSDEERKAGNADYRLGIIDYAITLESSTLSPEEFALAETTTYIRERPVRMDLGGTLAPDDGGSV